MNRIYALLLSLPLFSVTVLAHAQSVQRVSGDIVKLDGSTLQVKSSAGETMNVKLPDNVRIIAIDRADVTAIKPNAYVAVTSVPQPDGTLSAVEIRIFPEAMRGTGEGHRLMNNKPGDTMTNATVANIAPAKSAGDTMTNATVANISSGDKTRKMMVQYKGGQKQVIISDKVPVFTMEVADRTALTPGAHIVLNTTKQSDGSLVGDRLTVGKNGTVPPL